MTCPNCNSGLTSVKFHNLDIFHCKHCGVTFFEEFAVNRIDDKLARQLAADKMSDYVSGITKLCPLDQSPLSVITNSQSIPQDVQLLQCPKCKGIVAYPDDLVRFKIAQNAKINYFKAWNIPPALKSLVVLSFIAILSLAFFGNSLLFNQGNIVSTKAEDIVKNVNTSVSGRLLFISFRTPTPYTSRIIFYDKNAKTQIEKTISLKPVTLHYLVVSDIDLSHSIAYQIILTGKNANEYKTAQMKLKP